ncbi:MAG: POTRA domain-containing protein [Myxococcota bacterium]
MIRSRAWLWGVGLALASATAHAEVPPRLRGEPVVEVRIEGAAEGLTPAREIGIPLGAPVSRKLLRSAIRRLLDSGDWADVQIDLVPAANGVRVVAHLVPRLVVARLEILGNDAIGDTELGRMVGLRQEEELRREQLPELVRTVEEAYAERGYTRASVRVQIWDTDDPARKVVRFRIEEGAPMRITSLRFEGEAPPPGSRARTAIGLDLGDVLDERKVREAVRRGESRLREGGWLEAQLGPVRYERHGTGMAVVVPSRVGPRYRLAVAGTAPLDPKKVIEAMRLDEERLAGKANLQAMRERIVDLYRRHGFHDAQAKVRTAADAKPSTARLVVVVEPGKPLEVVRVAFPGARHFDVPFLRSQVFSFLEEDLGSDSILEPVDSHTVDELGFGGRSRGRSREVPKPLEVEPSQVYYEPTYERAVEHLRELYESEGFLDAKVGPERLERTEGHRAFVVVPVVEGPRTLLHQVELRGNRELSSRALLRATELARGKPFSHLALERARQEIQGLYQDRGYFYARVDTDVKYSEDRTRAHVRFQIVERYPVRIGEIIVEGAEHTDEDLILDLVSLRSGDLYRPAAAREAQKRLMKLGIFNSVTVGPQHPELAERVKGVVVTVTERSTQYIDFSAGVSTGEGVRGGFEYGYRNLFGHAVGLSLRVQLGHQFFFLDENLAQQYDRLSLAGRLERLVTLGMTIPHIHRLPNVTASANLYHQRDNERGFGLDKNGVNVTFSYRPLDWLTLTLSEDLENNDLELLLDTDYEDFLAQTDDRRLQRLLRVPEGRSTLVATRGTASFDFRDSPFVPTRGVYLSGTLEWARTLRTQSVDVGDMQETFFSNHLRVSLNGTGYVPVAGDVVLAAQVRYGRVIHLSSRSETYPNRRYFLGGADTLRGYREDALIPQDLANEIVRTSLGPDDVLRGGDTFLLVRGELRFPIAGDVHGGVFADMGNLWKQADQLDVLALRPTAGVGLRIATPVGPIAFDYGILILRREELEERFGAFHFSIGVY